MHAPPTAGPSADYNLRIAWPLARYVEERFGAPALDEVARASGLRRTDFDGKSRWVGYASFEALLARVRERMADDAEFQRAGVHRVREAYGPLLVVIWATTPGAVLRAMARNYALVAACGEMEMSPLGRTSARLRFRSRVPCSRLACLLRRAQGVALPTLWGLPPAEVDERACVAHGDPVCEMDCSWGEVRRWTPAGLGAAALACAGLALGSLGAGGVPVPLGLGLLGGALVYLLRERRERRREELGREEAIEALRALARHESDARGALLEMHLRRAEWTRLVEDEVRARDAALARVAAALHELAQAEASTLRGFSHDLKNPVLAVRLSVEYLQQLLAATASPDVARTLREVQEALARIQGSLQDLTVLARDARPRA